MPRTSQEIRFAKSLDGVRIAYAVSGKGKPLLKAANWLSHIEFDWDSPVWRHWLQSLSIRHQLIRYDERGCGLSDRDVTDLSFDSWVRDLETIANAAQLTRFPLLGISQGASVAIQYAVRNPDRVSHLILYGAYGRGRLVRDRSKEQLDEARMMQKLIEIGWGRENDAFRQVFTSQFIPGGSLEQLHAFNELQRISCSPKNAARFLTAFDIIDVMEAATRVRCPTIVLHARNDERVPFDEGRLLAAQIPGAQFVPLDSCNHVLLAEPAFDVLLEKLEDFLTDNERPDNNNDASFRELTARERQVLELIAQGLDNTVIAARLNIRAKTIRNHITRVFDKLDVRSRAEAIVKARESGLGRRPSK